MGNTLIGYGLWNKLLGKYDAALVTPWALSVPVSGFAASSGWLNKLLYWWKWLDCFDTRGLSDQSLGFKKGSLIYVFYKFLMARSQFMAHYSKLNLDRKVLSSKNINVFYTWIKNYYDA